MLLWSFIKDREPAMVAAVVQALLAVAVAWGTKLDANQVAALVAASAALFGFLTRQVVRPEAKVPSLPPSPGYSPVVEDVEDLVAPVTNTVAEVPDLAGEIVDQTLGRLPIIGRFIGRKR